MQEAGRIECPGCGKLIDADTNYCDKCGMRLVDINENIGNVESGGTDPLQQSARYQSREEPLQPMASQPTGAISSQVNVVDSSEADVVAIGSGATATSVEGDAVISSKPSEIHVEREITTVDATGAGIVAIGAGAFAAAAEKMQAEIRTQTATLNIEKAYLGDQKLETDRLPLVQVDSKICRKVKAVFVPPAEYEVLVKFAHEHPEERVFIVYGPKHSGRFT